jgi:hypothetical protein
MFEKDIKEIMDNFDWKFVRKTMKKLKWSYWDTPEDQKAPTIPQLQATASRLLHTCAYTLQSGQSEYDCATGGFYAKAKRYPDGVRFDLWFVLTTWDNEAVQ